MKLPSTRRLLDALRRIPLLGAVAEEAARVPGTVHLVGGLPRDCALGRPVPAEGVDIDVTVASRPEEFAARLARRLGGTAFLLHEATRVHRVALPDGSRVDVAQRQGRDILEDLSRRDFTADALALPLPLPDSPKGLLDPHEGLADLRRGVLRTVSEKAFTEDPLRLLRAFRLCACLGLRLDEKTARAVGKHRRRVRTCAGERIRVELLSLLKTPDAGTWLGRMDETGLLTAVFPELEAQRRCARVYYGEGGVLRHTLEVVSRLDLLLSSMDRIYPGLSGPIHDSLASAPGGLPARTALLKLAALLHDAAKPACARRVGERLRFFGHDERGAALSERVLRRLRFAREEIDTVSCLVRHHLRPGNLAAGGEVSDKALFRFFRDLGPHGVELLLLCWADHASYLSPRGLRSVLGRICDHPSPPRTRPGKAGAAPDARKTLHHLQTVSLLLRSRFEKPETVSPERILDGHSVMKALRVGPGPRVGEILRLLQEAQAEGKVRTRADALTFIRGL